jgi:hypothetical protein
MKGCLKTTNYFSLVQYSIFASYIVIIYPQFNGASFVLQTRITLSQKQINSM